MDIRLIALDMDGTLLNEKKEVSSRTIRVLEQCIERGLLVVPATGRILSGIPRVVMEIPGIRYAVTVNGAVIVDTKENETIAEARLSWEKALEVLEKVSSYPLMYDCYIDGFGKVEGRFLHHLENYGIQPNLRSLILSTREEVDDLKMYIRENHPSVDKINLFFGDMELRSRVREMLCEDESICVSSAVPYNLEINDRRATKGAGLQALAAHLGIATDQMMAFGDGENDLSMIKTAGWGIAMGNAVERLKQSARYVTLTNDEDGVADAIEKIIFNKEDR